MKTLKVLLVVALVTMSFCSVAFANVHVHGYQRSDGTYVQGHDRTDPNGTTSDNWSHEGNTNPNTGARGHHKN